MRAARLSSVGRFDFVEVADPRPPGPGQALVRAEAVSICGSDLAAYEGRHPRIKAPAILGHEFSGIVEQLGPGTDGPPVGTHASISPTLACRECRYCRQGRENVCERYAVIGEDADHPGAMAGYVTVYADHVHPIPGAMTPDEGAIVQPLSIGLHAVRDRGRVSAGETVLVVGAGPIGLAVLLFARAAGASVTVADVLPYRLRAARELGADRVVDVSSEDLPAVVKRSTDGYGADVTFEAVGGRTSAPFDGAFASTARTGRIVVLGSFSEPTLSVRLGELKYAEMEIIGSQAHPQVFDDVIAGIADGTIPARSLITHRLPLSQVESGFRLLAARDDDVMKVVLHPDTRTGGR
jgi:(R,R)-butanediol dehydrogenase / meso-butanediol dehydrogenase / diacetyl reductase